MYFLNSVFRSYFFCLPLGMNSIFGNFYSHEAM